MSSLTSLAPFFGIVMGSKDGTIQVRTGLKDSDEQDVIDLSSTGMGGGESGTYSSVPEGAIAVCMRGIGTSRNDTFCIGLLPIESKVSGQEGLADAKAGSSKYAVDTMQKGDVRMVEEFGGELYLKNNRIRLGNTVGGSVEIVKNGEESAIYTVSEQIYNFSNAGSERWGSAKRVSPHIRTRRPKRVGENNVGCDLDYIRSADDRALFAGNAANKAARKGAPRNPALAEYRRVYNHVTYSSGFLGYDTEQDQASSNSAVSASPQAMSKISRASEMGNCLYLAPHELVEVVVGNVIDIHGNLYDINYGQVLFGAKNAKVPVSDVVKAFESARRVSSRGVGYHFQLATNYKSSDETNSRNNFLFDIDKEGVLKVNIPMSSNSGNIPFSSNCNFLDDTGMVSRTFSNASKPDQIPVTLRDKDGGRVYPKMGASGDLQRYTGVRHSNNDGYFPGDSGFVRVNSTKHHNMYAAAERLIANTICQIVIPKNNNKCGFVYGNINADGAFERDNVGIDLDGDDKGPLHMSYIGVAPGKPAINTGGGTIAAGIRYTAEVDSKQNPINFPYSNSFVLSEDAKKATITDYSKETRLQTGGKSASINMEGSLELSLGQDNFDNKSFVLDTAGSVVAWLGADVNNRSLIMQTDGSMLINVGGSYDESGVMKPASFDLRVNVVDKGTVADDASEDAIGKKITNDSDFMISISEKGMVIAGMKKEAPMIIRNDGDLILESSSKLILSASALVDRTAGKPEKAVSKDSQSRDTSEGEGGTVTPDAVIDKMTCIADVLEILSDTLEESSDQ